MTRYKVHAFYHESYDTKVSITGCFDSLNKAIKEAIAIQKRFDDLAKKRGLPLEAFSPVWIDDREEATTYELAYDSNASYMFVECGTQTPRFIYE